MYYAKKNYWRSPVFNVLIIYKKLFYSHDVLKYIK